MEKVIPNFIYKDDSKDVSAFINENYPGTKLFFDKKKNELVVSHWNKKKCETVYNILNIINRFDLKVVK